MTRAAMKFPDAENQMLDFEDWLQPMFISIFGPLLTKLWLDQVNKAAFAALKCTDHFPNFLIAKNEFSRAVSIFMVKGV